MVDTASDKDRSKKVWGASPAGSTYAKDLAPDTKEFFEAVREQRRGYELPFLKTDIPFASWRGKMVLEVGCGAGFDAYEIASRGGNYTGIDITPENIGRCSAQLKAYGLAGRVLEGDGENLSFADGSFDVVYSNGVLHHTPDMGKSFREAHRVLGPGGEFWVILYHRTSVFYWVNLFLFDQVLRLGFLKRTMRERLSMIEYTTSAVRPLVNVYTKRELRSILEESGFDVSDIFVRRVIAEDFPGVGVLQSVLRKMPSAVFEKLGRRFGWYVIAKGVRAA